MKEEENAWQCSDITELSDQNRPTKIAEKMSELYENEWTEAFDCLERSMPEADIPIYLSGVLKEVFTTCKRLAWDDFFENIQADIYPHIKKEHRDPLSDVFKQQVKEYRKLRAPGMTKHLVKVVLKRIPPETLPIQSREMTAYFEKCLEVSWLAAVQDPPLALNFSPGEKFDTALFKAYNKSGPYVAFLVWPALHLYESGPLLTKGVAQGCEQKPYNCTRAIQPDPTLTTQNKPLRYSKRQLQTKIDDMEMMKMQADKRIIQLEDQIMVSSSQIDSLQQRLKEKRHEKEDALTKIMIAVLFAFV